MLQAPFLGAFYPFMHSYAVKLLIDIFTQNDKVSYAQAASPILLFVGGLILLSGAWRTHNYAQWTVIPKIRRDMMCTVYRYVMGHSHTFFQDNLSGSIVSKIKGISDGYYKVHAALEHSVAQPAWKGLVAFIALTTVNRTLGLIYMLFSLVYIPVTFIFFKRLGELEQNARNDYHTIIGSIADVITNMATVFSCATQRKEAQKLEHHYEKISIPLMNAAFRYDFWISIIIEGIYWVLLVGVFSYLVTLKNLGQISMGDIAFVMSMTFIFTESVWLATVASKDFIKDLGDFRASFALLRTPQHRLDQEGATDLVVTKGCVHFKEVSFGYTPKKMVFKDFSLLINAGEKVGIVGSSGAGKSTLVSLLLKNFKVQQGDILIDGQSIHNMTSDSLRSHIAFIPQDIMLFHRSIGDNIRYAREDASTEDIIHAAKVAHIHDFIMSLSNAYETLVGERGIKLSGGQRQRIAIARAILKKAPILVLDEATSSLDTQTEQEIQRAINQVLEENQATVLAIAHRLSTIRHMDRIVVMDRGHLVEQGTFQELMTLENGRFKNLWERQVQGFIL